MHNGVADRTRLLASCWGPMVGPALQLLLEISWLPYLAASAQ